MHIYLFLMNTVVPLICGFTLCGFSYSWLTMVPIVKWNIPQINNAKDILRDKETTFI